MVNTVCCSYTSWRWLIS